MFENTSKQDKAVNFIKKKLLLCIELIHNEMFVGCMTWFVGQQFGMGTQA